jgi:uncharacterized protein YhbP (UPF0306 family)
MAIERSKRRVSASRLATLAAELLDASPLCAIATVAPGSRAHVNTAYFAWSPNFDMVWMSEPDAEHSRNVRANKTVAIAVFDSGQTWGEPDRGIQLFGSAREVEGRAVERARQLYARRFPRFRELDLAAYRFYVFRARRLKLFDEPALGTGVFVTANVAGGGRLTWERTEIYRASRLGSRAS